MTPEKNVLSENQTDLEPGLIQFHDKYLPKLPTGKYAIHVNQTIKGDGLQEQGFERKQQFEVAGPRFCLPEGEIHSVYPPPNAEENFKGLLPQIVFRKRTLPWERSMYSVAETEDLQIPSMALLLFEEQELKFAKKDNPRKAIRTRAMMRSSEKLKNPGAGYLPPINLEAGLADEENCYTIDMSKSDFMALVPKAEELPYLTHVREVNTDDKEFLGMHADGWFSVILANRLPKTPPEVVAEDDITKLSGVKSIRNIAHLVSLEGFIPYLEQEPHQNLNKGKYKMVRLASLASWEFYCTPPEESFTKLMENLDVNLLKVENTDTIQNEYVKTALDGGYIPLQYHIRNGEKTMAWYRGPFMPVINDYRPAIEDEDTFFSVEAAMIYDDQKGLFDISYAAAWQIGRLMALSDSHFSQSLLDWKKGVNRKIDEFIKRRDLAAKQAVVTTSLSPEKTSSGAIELQDIQQLMSPDFATDIFSDNFLERLSIASYFFEKLTYDEDHLGVELENFPGVLKKEIYKEILEEGEDPMEGLRKAVFGG